MGRKKTSNARGGDDESLPIAAAATKSKKKGILIDDDEYSIGTELSEESVVQEEKVVITGKKKGRKGTSKASQSEENGDEEDSLAAREVVFSGKKKGKSKKVNSFSASSFGLLGGEDDDNEHKSDVDEDEEEEEAPVVSFSGKKKPSKSSKKSSGSLFSASAFDAIGDEEDGGEVVDDEEEEEETPVIEFTGKKKSSKGDKKKTSASLFAALGNEDEDEDEDGGDDDDEVAVPITFSGKKKKSSKSSSSVEVDEPSKVDNSNAEDDEEGSVISFTGKKKPTNKKKGPVMFAEPEIAEEVLEQPPIVSAKENAFKGVTAEEAVETVSKSKKKKKKSGRTAEEEDELEKILAELGEAPPPAPKLAAAAPPPPPPEEEKPVEAALVDEEGEEDTPAGESAAAKKKKKKKEKEKEKKAAAAAATAAATAVKEVKANVNVVDNKKLPKHVREMQEALARRKEAEERALREQEEKRRKEEEERLKEEEKKRLEEEARRRKREKEKAAIQRKKEEGNYFTRKQKNELKRLEQMKNQFLASSGSLPPSSVGDGEPVKKKAVYDNKKKHKHRAGQENGASAAAVETATAPEEVAVSTEVDPPETVEEAVEEERSEVSDLVKENGAEEEDEDEEGEEDEDEWDAKSWDNVDFSVSTFADEEAESDDKHVPKKELNKSASSSSRNGASSAPVQDTPKPNVAAEKQPIKSQDVEISKKQLEPQGPNKAKAKPASGDTKKLPAKTSDSAAPKGGEDLRSPICCIMGHVDTGKTKLLDCIRGTNVQEGEAGGITQQIGATYFPAENIRERTKELKADAVLKVPGLLVIDTPGHESFTNLRSRGSGLCDIAILVVDIMHGLEPQTIESLNLLKMRNTEFIVALNKVDRLYGWKTLRNAPIRKTLALQSRDVQNEFEMRLTQIVTEFKEQGLNTGLYYKSTKKDIGETIFIVPTSAITGEGIPDLLLLLVNWTQKTMVEKLTFSNEVQCTVLEVKVIEGHGTTIDVVLVNGVLHEGDQIVVCGMQGPIVTTIRALLTPHPMRELRIKGTYIHHKEIKAAQGIKITAQGLEHAIAGTGLYVVGPDDDVEDIKETTMEDMKTVMSRIDKSGEGVCVQASTLGSLEALLEFLKTPAVNIPVSGISIGPVHKKDIMKASVMLEKKKEFATILAFDVKVTTEARELAEELGVKIFMADIIYHLFDQFKAYIDSIKEERKKEAAEEAVFPCVLQIMPNCVFNKKDPIVLGVEVVGGIVKVGTPICIPDKDFIDIGRIASIENNHKPVDTAKKGQMVAIKILGTNPEEQQKMFGRHFDMEDKLVSHISRKSIDILKESYRDDLCMDDWRLLSKLKTIFKIQ